MRESYFDGRLLELIFIRLVWGFVTFISFGIAAPWALCAIYSWEARHTVVDGKRLCFDGTGGQLFGSWIKWFILTLITCGIYGFWLEIKLREWKISHTHTNTWID